MRRPVTQTKTNEETYSLQHFSELPVAFSLSDTHVGINDPARFCFVPSSKQVGEDGRVSQFMKVKLSVSASSVRESGLREVRIAVVV